MPIKVSASSTIETIGKRSACPGPLASRRLTFVSCPANAIICITPKYVCSGAFPAVQPLLFYDILKGEHGDAQKNHIKGHHQPQPRRLVRHRHHQRTRSEERRV